MALKTTVMTIRRLIADINHDLDKADRGNKTAAQRVRLSTIKFAKLAKIYRKESVTAAKKSRR